MWVVHTMTSFLLIHLQPENSTCKHNNLSNMMPIANHTMLQYHWPIIHIILDLCIVILDLIHIHHHNSTKTCTSWKPWNTYSFVYNQFCSGRLSDGNCVGRFSFSTTGTVLWWPCHTSRFDTQHSNTRASGWVSTSYLMWKQPSFISIIISHMQFIWKQTTLHTVISLIIKLGCQVVT